jgi:nitronate monooxygenase
VPISSSRKAPDAWRGREPEPAADASALAAYREDVERGAIPPVPQWAGEAVDLVTDLPSAADLVPARRRLLAAVS